MNQNLNLFMENHKKNNKIIILMSKHRNKYFKILSNKKKILTILMKYKLLKNLNNN